MLQWHLDALVGLYPVRAKVYYNYAPDPYVVADK